MIFTIINILWNCCCSFEENHTLCALLTHVHLHLADALIQSNLRKGYHSTGLAGRAGNSQLIAPFRAGQDGLGWHFSLTKQTYTQLLKSIVSRASCFFFLPHFVHRIFSLSMLCIAVSCTRRRLIVNIYTVCILIKFTKAMYEILHTKKYPIILDNNVEGKE